jgi:hypothetical protein
MAAALAVTSMVATAGAVSAATGCFTHTITFDVDSLAPMVVGDDNFSSHEYTSTWKVTVHWCQDNSGSHSNGSSTYALVSGWPWPVSVQNLASTSGTAPNEQATFVVTRHTGALYGPSHTTWCDFGFSDTIRVDSTGHGHLDRAVTFVSSSHLVDRDAFCLSGNLHWTGIPW